MAEREDPRITDLARYRKAREAEARRAASRTPEGPVGSNPRAKLILGFCGLVLLAFLLAPWVGKLF